MKNITKLSVLALALAAANSASAATLAASYTFDNTLAAGEPLAPSLVAIDPLSQNGFETAIVHGQSQTVYRWSGDGANSFNQAGLLLDATGLVPYNDYSVAMTFEFLTQAPFGGGWRRILDFENRQSDNGFYVNPGNFLEAVQVSPIAAGPTPYTTPGFHDMLLTVSPDGTRQHVQAYLDGNLEFTTTLDVFSLDNANNPGNLLQLFADNTAASAQQEYANGRIASLKIFSGTATPADVVPEPQAAALLLTSLCALGGFRRRS